MTDSDTPDHRGCAPTSAAGVPGAAALALARQLADIARAIGGQPDLDATMAAVCDLARGVVDGCDHAAVSLVSRGRISTHGASDPVPEMVDRLQYEAGEGPCVEALAGADCVETPDLRDEARWPAFSSRAAEATPVRAIMALRLAEGDRTIGALNLYSDRPGAFDGASPTADIASLFAAHATMALIAARNHGNLQEALASRSTISLAIGILMARQRVSEEQAFGMLKRASQRTNTKLRDLAEQLTARVVAEQQVAEQHGPAAPDGEGSIAMAPPTSAMELPAPAAPDVSAEGH